MTSLPLVEELRLGLLGELLLAALLGGAIGLEREVNGKPAGFRTNLLICLGAALLTHLSVEVARAGGPVAAVRGDPARIAAQVVSGIGFLGAGTILQSRGSIIGLTTAATLWVVAAIGIAVGAREYVAAVGTTSLVLVTLLILGKVEHRLVRRRIHTLRLTLAPDLDALEGARDLLTERGYRVRTEDVVQDEVSLQATVEVAGARGPFDATVTALLRSPGVRGVRVV